VDSDIRERLRSALKDHYELGGEIGRGGMAIVYRAKDLRHGRDVALKVLRPDVAESVGADRFLNEVRLIARLTHPHIVPLHDSGDIDGLLYYVMPFVGGESLRARLLREGTLPVADAIRIAREVADALAHAHEHDVVHRDIKPENILLESGHAVVSDFGIARAISGTSDIGITGTGVAIGTHHYMSPEQASGQAGLDGRSDIYSLGCVLFEMLSGRPPFADPNGPGQRTGSGPGEVTALGRARPAIPRYVIVALRTALAADPAHRFATAAEFATGLADDPTVREAVRRLVPRRRWAMVAGAAVIGAGVALAVWSRHARPALDPRRVVVFGFKGDGALTGVAANTSDAVRNVLDGTRYFRGIDGRRYTPASAGRDPSLEELGAVAARFRAGAYIEGNVFDSDSIRLVLRLRFTGIDSVVNANLAFAHGTKPWDIGLRATQELLPSLSGTKVNLDVVRMRSPAAATAFLFGENSYRADRFDEAFDHYREAVRLDSGFAQAALKGAQSASWKLRTSDARRLIAVALAHDSTLGQETLLLARGLEAYLAARGDSAVRIFQQALERDDASPETWMALGEVYTHLLPRSGAIDVLAREAFERVRRLDPGFVPVTYHLFEIAARENDIPHARVLLSGLRAARADSTELLSSEVMFECLTRSREQVDWRGWATRNAGAAIIQAARALTVGGLHQPACAEAAWRAALTYGTSRAQRWGALQGLQSTLVAQGKFGEADTLLQSDTDFGLELMQMIALLDVDAGAAGAIRSRATAGVARARRVFAAKPAALSEAWLWLVGAREASEGRLADARLVRDTLTARAKGSGEWSDRRLATSLAARTALAGLDTNGAVQLLSALNPEAEKASLEWDAFASFGSDRMLLAKIHFARRHYEAAQFYASLVDSPAPVWYAIYLPSSLQLRLNAAAALGDGRMVEGLERRLRSLGRQDLLKRGR
jgi:tetratricopeptide (TPR) repeat protein